MDLGVWGGILESLGHHLGRSWSVFGGSWRVLAASWEDLGEGWGRSEWARGAKTKKMSKKRGGNPPQGGGLGDPLDAKIDPRRKEIKEKMDQAGKLKISIWTRKTRVQIDLGGDMECQI